MEKQLFYLPKHIEICVLYPLRTYKNVYIKTPFLKKLIDKHLTSLLVCFEIRKGNWSSSKKEMFIRRCYMWMVLSGNANYCLIKPDILMINSVFQIKS